MQTRKTTHTTFFNHIINIKNFDPNKIKITIKSSNSVTPLYLIINKVNGYFEEINKNKYLTLVPTNENKEIIKNVKNCGVKSET